MFNFRTLFTNQKRPTLISPDQVLAVLGTVLEPEINRDIVSLGMVKNVACHQGDVSFTIQLREPGSPLQVPIERRSRKALMQIPGVQAVQIAFETVGHTQLQKTTPLAINAKFVIAVASGKGGVGKSTVAVNLAVALAQNKQRVGLLDGDIHGPNVPMMMGIYEERPILFGEQIFPPTAHGVAVMSMGLMIPANTPVIWRGPMLHQALRQMVRDVMWGELDYLIVDLPPGTGDVQLTLTQSLPLTGAILVTTPQDVAAADVLKGGEMFRQLGVPLLGLVENMSYYLCPHCGKPEYLFGRGAGERLCQQLQTTLLAQTPFDVTVRAGGDLGIPIVLSAPESPAGASFRQATEAVIERIRNLPQPKKPVVFMQDPDLHMI